MPNVNGIFRNIGKKYSSMGKWIKTGHYECIDKTDTMLIYIATKINELIFRNQYNKLLE